METRANYALIGLFTLAVIAAAFGFVYWFSGGERGQARQNIRIVFSGSVSGLSQGSSVSFNGLRVGEVTSLDLLPEDPRRVVAIATVNSNTPIRSDTRARLEYQGLTGVANVGLSGGEAGAPPLVAGPGQPMPTIFADRSDFQDLIETARNIARRADDVLERVGRVIADNEGSINRTVQNVERFSQALGENAEGIDRFLAQVGQAAEKVGPLAEKLETLATNVDEVVRSVDRQRVARIVENVDNFTTALGENRQVVSDALKDAASLIARLNETAPKLDTAVAEIAEVTKAIDPAKIGRTVDNVDTFTQTLSRRSPDIDKAIQEARSITEKLNRSADKIDSVLAGAEKFLGSASGESGKSAFDEIRAAAVAVRELANDLNTRTEGIQGILGGVNRFTESGLREYEALAVEGRKTLGDISRAVRSIERNPQQFIFGGSPNLPQYNGRR
ncbi:MlaD family protein [Microvirga lotononidis]|uniref:ABC-type transport system involved in resistance to organic solvents, periplasmic component n=1 Tax=Microvirga lotononidis TaxID=864069 RepID=I4YW72_9HYPH|nr:MlaD family protein [Microvirga lotononidis]EIM28214.1 ABC-type transport system involved in resistance to organic solvents, periplasmic component [Microvirga lotononidis]WQO27688.1 MlaD family protein [Microvirga lotononidis]